MRLFDVCFKWLKLTICFGQGFDAARAKYFANFLSVLINGDPLQVRAELSSGCDERVTAIMTEGGGFSTLIALCHLNTFLAL